jgi:simple sugar transport system permease protein
VSDFLQALWNVISSDSLYESTVRFSALLAFAAIGEWVAERTGTLNISVEAMLLCGAFGSALGSYLSHNVWIAVLCGVVGGLVVALVQANMSHRLAANQFIVGLTLNVLAVGLTAYLNAQIRPQVERAGVVKIPLLSSIPLIGSALFDQSWVLYLVYPLIPLAWWLVYRTRWGLEARSVGENPQSADVSGIHVNKRRRQGIYFVGITSGLGGAYLTLGLVGSFGADGVSGRGFLALAAVIFGGWTLKGTIAGVLVFGAFDALHYVLQSLGYDINTQLLVSLPYVMALATMLLFATRTRKPNALAMPFVRGLT